MDSREIDNVEIEKAKAMMRYNQIRNIAEMFRALEVCVALTFLSWLWNRFPNAFKISSEYFTKITVQLFNSHVAFLIGNAIVVVLYLLYRLNDAGQNNNQVVADLYDEYVQNSVAGETPLQETETIRYDDKQIVPSENVDTKIKCDEIGAAIEESTKEIRRFERTQSQKLKRELRVKPRPELRRSVTVIRGSGDEKAITSFGTVEDQSNEEFRRTIEEFIEQQRFLWMQKKVEKKLVNKDLI